MWFVFIGVNGFKCFDLFVVVVVIIEFLFFFFGFVVNVGF